MSNLLERTDKGYILFEKLEKGGYAVIEAFSDKHKLIDYLEKSKIKIDEFGDTIGHLEVRFELKKYKKE